jgi:hypothetical protein
MSTPRYAKAMQRRAFQSAHEVPSFRAGFEALAPIPKQIYTWVVSARTAYFALFTGIHPQPMADQSLVTTL